MTTAAVVGASGYLGGELLRILLAHPGVTVTQVAAVKNAGRRVDSVHPHLRARTDLTFRPPESLEPCDALLFATPHRTTMDLLPKLAGLAHHVLDLSGDFRLHDAHAYRSHYGVEHSAPELLGTFVTGLPEVYRSRLRTTDRVTVPGCVATAAMLALWPLAARGLLAPDVLVDARVGSSGAGAGVGSANLHAERSRALRVFAPLHHRHEAEVAQLTGLRVRVTATAVEAVRGVQILCHGLLAGALDERDLRSLYREAYADEPFVRVVAQRRGTHRYPDPKTLLGSNYCDVGFAADPGSRRVVLIAALDNLVKGGAGNAVQCLNIRTGHAEDAGLDFAGLHPV